MKNPLITKCILTGYNCEKFFQKLNTEFDKQANYKKPKRGSENQSLTLEILGSVPAIYELMFSTSTRFSGELIRGDLL